MDKYDPATIEPKWQKYWEENKINSPDMDKAKKPFYNLMMFPYPSAEGLHVGNMYAFVHADAYGRFMRLRGFDVFEPIGLDGFGIHSENYAIKQGEHILDVSKRTEKHFYEQLRMIGNQYDWTRHLETYKPDYYKWTQWVFVQMFKKGLAYQAESNVNWCSSCKTVLSDEQVISGKCERCGTLVEKKMMKQWFFKITDYAERLLKNLEIINWSERTKIAQRNWIGKSEGAQFEMKVVSTPSQSPPSQGGEEVGVIKVFTTRLDTVFGMTYAVIAPEHPLIANSKLPIANRKEVEEYIERSREKSDLERTELAKEKTGVELKGVKLINPFNSETIPVFVGDYVLGHYGTGAVMAVPAHDERDFEFAKKYGLEIREVIKSADGMSSVERKAFTEDGVLSNSNEYDNTTSEEAREKLAKWLEENNIGGKKINYKLRDWCVSRQRYWGPPIPIIHCEKCGSTGLPQAVPVPEKDLPVLLPETKDYLPKPDGLSPLARNENFVKTKCPKCGEDARRETDVSDTFLDSAWYFFRYPSVGAKNSELEIGNWKLEIPWNQQITRQWLPVDMYIGGNEHAVLHLLYSRFVTMFFKDLGLIDFDEPYKRFFAHGLLIREGAKMSKSKGNVINPDEYVKKYGADSVRMYLMFLGDVRQGGDWQDAGMNGMHKFANRIWRINSKVQNPNSKQISNSKIKNYKLGTLLHKTIKKVTEDLEGLKFNTAISALMILVNAFEKEDEISGEDFGIFLTLLSPFAPHIAEELWSQLGGPSTSLRAKKMSIFFEKWPEYDPALVKDEMITLIVQINGKVRDKIEVAANISEDDAKKIALQSPNVKKFLAGQEAKKVIFVRGRLINIVV